MIVILLVGIAAGIAILTAFDMPHDQVCRVIPNYTEQAYDDPHMYSSDPEMQLYDFRQEFGDSWAGGHYDEKEDVMEVCWFKET